MVTARLFVMNDEDIERMEELDETDLEWILNALRTTQIRQQELVAETRGKKLTRNDVLEAMGEPPEIENVLEFDLGEDMFLPNYNYVTELREKLVTLCGRDLTDG